MISRGDYQGRPGLSWGRIALGGVGGAEIGLWVGHPVGARIGGRVWESGDGMHEIVGVPSLVRIRSRCECGSRAELVEGRRKESHWKKGDDGADWPESQELCILLKLKTEEGGRTDSELGARLFNTQRRRSGWKGLPGPCAQRGRHFKGDQRRNALESACPRPSLGSATSVCHWAGDSPSSEK